MIERVTTADKLIGLINLPDEIETFLDVPAKREEIIQFIFSQVHNERMGIWVHRDEDGDIDAWLWMFDNVLPPLSYTTSVMFVWSGANDPQVIYDFQEVGDNWTIERGAKMIVAVTEVLPPRWFEKYGFKKSKKTLVERIVRY